MLITWNIWQLDLPSPGKKIHVTNNRSGNRTSTTGCNIWQRLLYNTTLNNKHLQAKKQKSLHPQNTGLLATGWHIQWCGTSSISVYKAHTWFAFSGGWVFHMLSSGTMQRYVRLGNWFCYAELCFRPDGMNYVLWLPVSMNTGQTAQLPDQTSVQQHVRSWTKVQETTESSLSEYSTVLFPWLPIQHLNCQTSSQRKGTFAHERRTWWWPIISFLDFLTSRSDKCRTDGLVARPVRNAKACSLMEKRPTGVIVRSWKQTQLIT